MAPASDFTGPEYTGPERRKRVLYDPRLTLGMVVQAATIAGSVASGIFASGLYVQSLRDEIAAMGKSQATVQAQTTEKDQALMQQIIRQTGTGNSHAGKCR